MADRETTRLKAEISETRKRGKRARYPDELKARALAYVTRRRAHGDSFSAIAKDLGLGISTLDTWKRGGTERRGRLRRVVVAKPKEAEERRFTVEGRGGLRVVGLSLDELRELLGGGL